MLLQLLLPTTLRGRQCVRMDQVFLARLNSDSVRFRFGGNQRPSQSRANTTNRGKNP